MPLVQEMQHPNSLDFANQRRGVMIRDREGLPWHRIRLRVWNLNGEHPSKELCRTVYKDFNKRIGRVKYRYKNCGRKKWKVTKEVESFVSFEEAEGSAQNLHLHFDDLAKRASEGKECGAGDVDHSEGAGETWIPVASAEPETKVQQRRP